MFVLPLMASINAINQRNNAALNMMGAAESQLGLVRNLDFTSVDTFTPSNMNNVLRQEQKISFGRLLNETLYKVYTAQLEALEKAEKNNIKK